MAGLCLTCTRSPDSGPSEMKPSLTCGAGPHVSAAMSLPTSCMCTTFREANLRAGLPVWCVPCGMYKASKRRSSEVGSRLACGASLSDKRCQEHLLQAAGVAQQLHVHCAEHLCHRLVHMTDHHHAALCPICSCTATSQRSVPAECWW